MTTPNKGDFLTAFQNGQDFAVKLAEVLNLPKHICRLEIIMTNDQPVVIKCEYYDYLNNFNKDDMPVLFGEYELHKIEKI